MSTMMHNSTRLLSLVGVVMLLLLFSPPLAAQDDSPPPTPAAVTEPDTADLTPIPDTSSDPASDSTGTDVQNQEPVAADQQATCRPKGVQTVRIDNTTTTWVSAMQPLIPPAPGGILVVGNVFTQTRNYSLWSLVKFNFTAQNLPTKSQICEANIRMERNGSYNRGSGISPAAFQMAGPWSPGQSFQQIASIPRGAVLGGVSLSSSALSIEAKGAAEGWLVNPSRNYGFVVQTNKANTDNVNSFRQGATMELKVQCDFYNPTSWLNGLDRYNQANFKVAWDGTDPRDPAATNCTPTGIETYSVRYRVAGSSWSPYYDGSGKSKTFTGKVNDGDKVDFEVAATDHARNAQGYGSRVTTVVDFVPPWVVFNPPPGQYTYAENFEVRWSARDAVSGPKSCTARYRIGTGGWNGANVNEVSRPSDKETIFNFNIVGANQDQFYQFEITCQDNVGNVMPGPATASTTISLFPDAGMNNITPNYITVTAPFAVSWYGQTPPERRIVWYDVYYRNRTDGQPWQKQNFSADVTSATFPFDGSQPSPGLWEFETTATNEQGQTTRFKGVPEASIVIDPSGTGGQGWLPVLGRQ